MTSSIKAVGAEHVHNHCHMELSVPLYLGHLLARVQPECLIHVTGDSIVYKGGLDPVCDLFFSCKVKESASEMLFPFLVLLRWLNLSE